MEDASRGRRILRPGARPDDEREVPDLALDPHDRGRGPEREPDLLGRGRCAGSAQAPDRARRIAQAAGFGGVRLERLEALARVGQSAIEGREIARFPGREEEAREVGRRALEAARDAFGDARRPDGLGESQPGDGLLPFRDQRLAGQGKTRAERSRQRALAELEQRPLGVGGDVAENPAKSLAVVDTHRPPEFRVERRCERDARGRGAGAPREALGGLAEEDLGPGIRRSLRPKAGRAPREERRREREACVVGREIAPDDDEIPAAFGTIREEGV